MIKAVWGMDYDPNTDSIYKCPCCGNCGEALIKDEDGYICWAKSEPNEIDEEMQAWFAEREGIKVEYKDCFMGCDGKGTVKVVYRKNWNTLEWETAYGVCESCGCRFIV